MFRTLFAIVTLVIAASAFGQGLPSHYPAEGFNRTGVVHAIYYDESRIVINDVPYLYSSAIIVHSLSSRRAPFSRVRTGTKVAYKLGSDRKIIEMWLLPPNYSDVRGR